MRKLPKEKRFNSEEIDKVMAGKKGNELKNAVIETYSELQDKVEGITTQKEFKALIAQLIKQLPEDKMEYIEAPLPTGIDKSIFAILPEIIYIPAVKDITDDIKTKETTSYGKILKVLLDMISETDELKKIGDSFTQLKTLLNKEIKEDGTILDDRLPQIKEVETVIGKLLSDQFPYAKLEFEIPPPELKTIFSGARIFVDDGIRDVIETKGDGMKRAVTFALLRGYVEIREKTKTKESFESENILCVSTHSPYFLSPESTETFLRFQKKDSIEEQPPYAQIRPVDLLNDMPKKDAFQILCFENNNAAFFCDHVVLCEGDSDIIYLKHISKTISHDWDFEKKNIGLIQIGGKGNFARYREFFECFGVSVQIITDLDAIVDQYEGLGASSECDSLREELLKEIEKLIASNPTFNVTREQAKAITSKRVFKERYDRVKEISSKISKGGQITPEEAEDCKNLFSEEKNYQRCQIIREHQSVKTKRDQLISALRKEGIHVLLKGSIDDYYPEGVEGKDKPTRALSACKKIKTKEDVFKTCDTISYEGQAISELQVIFDCIFNNV